MLGFFILILQQMIDGWQNMGINDRCEPEDDSADVGLASCIESGTQGDDQSGHADLGDLQDEDIDEDKFLLEEKLRTCVKQKSDLEKKFEKSQYEKSSLEDSLKQCQLENCSLRDRLEQNNNAFEQKEDADPECQDAEEMTEVMDESISPHAVSRIEMALRCTVHPFDIIPILLIFDSDILTVPEREQIQQDTNNYGRSQGASSLLDCLRRHVGWSETLVKALSHPLIKLSHVAQVVGKAVGFDPEMMIQLMREGEFPDNQEIGETNDETSVKVMVDSAELTDSVDGEIGQKTRMDRLQKENDCLKKELQNNQCLRQKDLKLFLDNLDIFSKKHCEEKISLQQTLETERQERTNLEHSLEKDRQEKIRLEQCMEKERQEKIRLEQFLETEREEKTNLEHSLEKERQEKIRLEQCKEKERQERSRLEERLKQFTDSAAAGEKAEPEPAQLQEIDQPQIGFLATAPVSLCQSVTQYEQIKCFTEVAFNPGGHFRPSDSAYKVPVTGQYRITLEHSQRAEETEGGIGLQVVRETRKSGSKTWERVWRWGRVTETWGKTTARSSGGDKLTDRSEWVGDLCEGDRLWVRVWRVLSGPKLVSPCSFACLLER